MNIHSRIAKLEADAGTKAISVDGPAIRAEIYRLLTAEPNKVESIRKAALAEDCNPALRSQINPPAE